MGLRRTHALWLRIIIYSGHLRAYEETRTQRFCGDTYSQHSPFTFQLTRSLHLLQLLARWAWRIQSSAAMVPAAATAAVAALLFVSAAPSALAQPFQPGFGLSPLGNLRTTDRDGAISLPVGN